MTQQTPPAASRVQRMLAFVISGLVVLSLVAIVVLIVGYTVAQADEGQGKGIWPAIFFIPYLALPIAFVLMIVLLVMTFVKRSRANREPRG